MLPRDYLWRSTSQYRRAPSRPSHRRPISYAEVAETVAHLGQRQEFSIGLCHPPLNFGNLLIGQLQIVVLAGAIVDDRARCRRLILQAVTKNRR